MTDPNDPKGLIREAYRIEGISAPECRTIFLDWALGVPPDANPRAAVTALLDRYAGEPRDHPMTQTLKEALNESAAPKRRGGRAARLA
ncbi:hypothetical protein [Cognatiyoonia sp. IB215182]|uniref:hypothetical protein n=1 Tax=Cognatiyoonia sp. IB215182 TaxID=3097353 RepID=UPI002A1433F2|nr:hypothetical protein [Cognatiyoonia sp. IB215182]MDX8352166.1 hypothetical protein [Cognatiyoonia sp. IB215182]